MDENTMIAVILGGAGILAVLITVLVARLVGGTVPRFSQFVPFLGDLNQSCTKSTDF